LKGVEVKILEVERKKSVVRKEKKELKRNKDRASKKSFLKHRL